MWSHLMYVQRCQSSLHVSMIAYTSNSYALKEIIWNTTRIPLIYIVSHNYLFHSSPSRLKLIRNAGLISIGFMSITRQISSS